MKVNCNKLAVVNTGSDSITIVDLNNDFNIINISLSQPYPCLRPHQIVKSNACNILYCINSYNNTIYKIDIHKEKIIDYLVVGSSPSHMEVLDGYLIVTNSDSNSVSIIDEESFSLVENIPMGDKPHDIKVDNNNNIYITNSNSYNINVLNMKNNTCDDIKIPCKSLHLAIGRENLYILCPLNNGMIKSSILILDLKSKKILDKINIEGVVIDMLVVEEKKTIYTTNIDDGHLYKIDLYENNKIDKYYLGGMPNSIIWDNNRTLFITNVLDNSLILFDLEEEVITKKIKVGLEPSGLLLL